MADYVSGGPILAMATGGMHAEFTASLLDRMIADDEAIDCWERPAPRRRH